jgi:formylglycine-generating enzyme required for sulfatase activity
MISRRSVFFFLCALLLTLSAWQNVSAQQKFALVMGNGAYRNLGRLNNPVNDANDMKAALQGLGFTVDTVVDGSRVQMEEAIERFKNRLSVSKNSYGFFFYAGHGVQSGGVNYLIPVDADIRSEAYLRDRSVSVQAMLDEINAAGNELNIVVLDACRDSPFSWSRSGSRGLQVVANQPADSIIVYATSAGSIAADGEGRNGLFTAHLLNNLKKPGLEVNEVFRLTMGDVARASGNRQRPAVYNQFPGTAYLSGRPPAVVPAVAPQPERPVPANMVRIQGGTFMMGSPTSEAGRSGDETQRQVTVGSFYMGNYEVTQAEYESVMGTNPSAFTGANLPVEQVSWYDAVEYCNALSRKEGLTPAYTITGTGNSRNVSWNRASNGYRLPTEAEWEYACRAGTTTPYYSGSSVDNAGWFGGNSGYGTHEVGSKQANPWGLYDMHGNLWEWCWDRYGAYAGGAQTDPTGASSGTNRVKRGGSWAYGVVHVRSAYRGNNTPSYRVKDLGFRLVRPLV